MRDRQSQIKSMSIAACGALMGLLGLTACDREDRTLPKGGPSGVASGQPAGHEMPEGVTLDPGSPFSPTLVLEPRPGKPHLLHVEVSIADGKKLHRLRVLGAGPGFVELARKETGQLDSNTVKASFEIPAQAGSRKARHLLVVADFGSGSFAAKQALPMF